MGVNTVWDPLYFTAKWHLFYVPLEKVSHPPSPPSRHSHINVNVYCIAIIIDTSSHWCVGSLTRRVHSHLRASVRSVLSHDRFCYCQLFLFCFKGSIISTACRLSCFLKEKENTFLWVSLVYDNVNSFQQLESMRLYLKSHLLTSPSLYFDNCLFLNDR